MVGAWSTHGNKFIKNRSENLKGRDNLEDLGIDGRIILMDIR
jgi:hypothetical protein